MPVSHRTAAARSAVRRAGLCIDRTDADRSVRALDELPVADLADAIVEEKVSSLLLSRLRDERAGLVDDLHRQPRFTDARTRIEILERYKDDVLGLIDREARSQGVTVWAVKGLAAQPTYPDPSLRDLGDLDLMTATIDDAIRLTGRLQSEGYAFHGGELPWMKRSVDSGVIYGQFSLAPTPAGSRPAIDLHFGGYSVRHCGLHPLDPAESSSGVSYYTTQQNLPLMVGNAAGDHRITTKDVNDLAIALEEPEVDWARLVRELDAVCLLGFLGRLVDELDATPLQALYRDSALRSLVDGVRRERPAPDSTWAGRRRWAATVRHAYAVGVRHSYRRATVTSLSAARYYWGHRGVQVRRRRRRPVPQLPELNNWTCVRLVPAGMLSRYSHEPDDHASKQPFLTVAGPRRSLTAEAETIHTSVGDIVRTSLGDFVPLVYDLDERLATSGP